MDRDHSDDASAKERRSFDVAKMSGAEVAAEIAQRMTRWRRGRSRADGAVGAARVEAAPSEVAAMPDVEAMAPPTEGVLSGGAGARMERALQRATAARHHPVGAPPAESIAVATPPEPRAEQEAERPKLLPRSPWRARWPMAVLVVAAVAITSWILLPLGRPPPPPIARDVEAPPAADAGASHAPTPAPDLRAPIAVPSPQKPQALAPARTPAPLPPQTKPTSQLPTLIARLKPDGTIVAKPVPAPVMQPASTPAQVPPPRTGSRTTPAPDPARSTGRDDGLNDLFERMFSDGLGRRLPCRHKRRSSRRPIRVRSW